MNPSRLAKYPHFWFKNIDAYKEHLSQGFRKVSMEANSRNFFVSHNTAPLDILTVSAVHIDSAADLVADTDAKPRYILTRIESGGVDFTTDRRSFSLGAGESLLTLPTWQRARNTPNVDAICVIIPPDLFEDEAAKLIGRPTRKIPFEVTGPLNRQSPVWALLNLILDQLDQDSGLFSTARIAAQELQHAFITSLVEGTPNTYRQYLDTQNYTVPLWCVKAVTKAQDYIDGHLLSPLSRGDVAAAAGVTSSVLNRAFKSFLHMTPTQFKWERRLERAHWMLLVPEPETDVKSVAHKCLFPRLVDFKRMYTAYFKGETPNETLLKGLSRLL